MCETPELQGSSVRLHYSAYTAGQSADAEPIRFTERITLPGELADAAAEPVHGLLRLLSLAAAPSYFKAFVPSTFEVPGGLTDVERRFVTELLGNGLGEFAYTNDLAEALTPEIIAPRLESRPGGGSADLERAEPRRPLVAVGGGKDSVVSIETMKTAGLDLGLFAINPRPPMRGTAEVARLPLVTAGRAIDPELLRLNAEGRPNGHVPVTAINSLIAMLSAVASGYDAVVFSNEAGASFGNVQWQGREINHQWSKSIDFERLLRGALPTGSPVYFSLLRPVSEIRIARRFAGLTDYHSVFTSCNRAFRMAAAENATWCGECDKCRFIFLMLAPFMPRRDLLEIFSGRDLLLDPEQFTGFLELLGAEGLIKPFECVGEPQECRVALSLLSEHDDWRDDEVLRRPEFAALAATPEESATVFAWSDEHCLPRSLEAVAREI